MSIDRRSEWEDAPPRYRFLYQQKILEASCVDAERDAPEVVSTKVRAMWASLSDRLICNNVQFDVTDGSVLKYAVTSHFDAFLYDVRRWGVPLNKVDTSDGRTLLDYVTFQEQRNAGTAIAQKMRFYYNFLRDAGAKHASELK